MGGLWSTLRAHGSGPVAVPTPATPARRRDDSPALSPPRARRHGIRARECTTTTTMMDAHGRDALRTGAAQAASRGEAWTTATTATTAREHLRKVQCVADVMSEQRERAGDAGAAVPAEATTISGALARTFEQRKFTRVVVPDGDRERARCVGRAQTRKAPRGSESSGVAARARNHCDVVVDLTVVGIVRV